MADADWMLYRQLRGRPLPETIELGAARYRQERLFKRDFYAATGVYRLQSGMETPATPAQIVLKVYHTDPCGPIPLGWLGRRLCRREVSYMRCLEGVPGCARLLGRHGEAGFVREYVPGCHLRDFRKQGDPDDAFFPVLRETLAAIHALGVAHNDLSKPENILVRPDATPAIIDFQIAARCAFRWPLCRPIGRFVLRYLQAVDRYHLDKHNRRLRPQDFTAEELRRVRRKGSALSLHGLLLRRPYRAVRHFIMDRFLRVD